MTSLSSLGRRRDFAAPLPAAKTTPLGHQEEQNLNAYGPTRSRSRSGFS